MECTLDVVNLDRWDLILGNPFANEFGVKLDYSDRTIRFGDTNLHALTREEEATVREAGSKAHLAPTQP